MRFSGLSMSKHHLSGTPHTPCRWLQALGSLAYILLTLPLFVLVGQGFIAISSHFIPQLAVIGQALWLSLWTSLISLIVILCLGTPLAYIFARWQFRGRQLAQVILELPIVMPPAVAGLALLLTFGRRGLIGQWLALLGVHIPFTALAVIIAQIFVAAPFFIRTAQVGFANIDPDLEAAARVDGATNWDVLRYITLPLSRHALGAGLILSWTRAIGEFGATMVFAGNLQGETQTMPLLVYYTFERDINAAVWVSLLLLLIAFVALMSSHLLERIQA